MNAIMNDSKRGDGEACDILVNYVRKCFDALWLQECINELKWPNQCQALHDILLQNVNIAKKYPCGLSERFAIHNKVMQGTIWTVLMCTCTMDSMGKWYIKVNFAM